MLTGWKSIAEYTGLSRNTILKLVDTEAFPLQYIGDKPVSSKKWIQDWLDTRIKQEHVRRLQKTDA